MQVFEKVVRSVDEEASCDAVPRLGLVSEDVYKFARGHHEIVIFGNLHNFARTRVRNVYLHERILLTLQIVEVVYIWVQLELVLFFAAIEDEVRREQAKVAEFVSKSLIA